MILPVEDTTPLSFPLFLLPVHGLPLEHWNQASLDKDCALREETLGERDCCLGVAQATLPFYLLLLPVGLRGGWLASELRIQDPHFNVPYSLFLQNFSSWVCLSAHDSKSSTPLLHEIHLYLSRISIISAFTASWNMLMCMCFLAFHWIVISDSYIALFTYPTEGLASVFACGI